ncbi:MAG: hypothetical protein U0872_01235 [Planctomycetaceae bacterium]
MERSARIAIRRFRCGFGPFQVLVDGTEVASVAGSEPLMLCVTPGAHTLSIKNVGNRSRVETVTLEPGEIAEFECQSQFWRDWSKRGRFFWWSAGWNWWDLSCPWLIRIPLAKPMSQQPLQP